MGYGPLISALTAPMLSGVLVASLLRPRWRKDLRERFGAAVAPVQPGCIWIHAASVGEVGAAFTLVERLPGPLLVTADTDTGALRARQLAQGAPRVAVSRKPVDHRYTLSPLWSEARPRAVVFVEGTFWPALAAMAREAAVPVLRVSAKASGRTRAIGRLAGGALWPADVVLARDAGEAAFFSRLYAGRATEVAISGDLKADLPRREPALRWKRPFLAICSARARDVARTLEAMEALGLGWQVLAAPRHPDRFDMGEISGRKVLRRSEMRGGDVPADVDVLLLDTLGELASEVAGAVVAVIGGSFDAQIGGHSPFEALAAGVPVAAGPCVSSQGRAFEGLPHGPDLAASLARAIAGPRPRAEGGAADRVARVVIERAARPAPEAPPRPWLRPVVPVVRAASGLRGLAHARGWMPLLSLPVPVISVGSPNARSPGRTSTVRALVGALMGRGHRVGVAVRGYRRLAGGRGIHITSDPALVGDEGALLCEAGAIVAAGPDRAEGARRLCEAGATVILLDDGLSVRGLRKDLEIIVVDARFPLARGMLPMGDRREIDPVPRRADVVLVHHADGRFSFPGEAAIRRPGPWQPSAPRGPVAAFAGIGRPADLLASLDVPVARFRALPDHGAIDLTELFAWADGLPLVCTAKDAARLDPRDRRGLFYREIVVELPGALLERLPVAPVR